MFVICFLLLSTKGLRCIALYKRRCIIILLNIIIINWQIISLSTKLSSLYKINVHDLNPKETYTLVIFGHLLLSQNLFIFTFPPPTTAFMTMTSIQKNPACYFRTPFIKSELFFTFHLHQNVTRYLNNWKKSSLKIKSSCVYIPLIRGYGTPNYKLIN